MKRQIPVLGLDLGGLTETVTQPLPLLFKAGVRLPELLAGALLRTIERQFGDECYKTGAGALLTFPLSRREPTSPQPPSVPWPPPRTCFVASRTKASN